MIVSHGRPLPCRITGGTGVDPDRFLLLPLAIIGGGPRKWEKRNGRLTRDSRGLR